MLEYLARMCAAGAAKSGPVLPESDDIDEKQGLVAVSVSATTDGDSRQNVAIKQHSCRVTHSTFDLTLEMEPVGVGRIIAKASKRIEKERPKSTSLR